MESFTRRTCEGVAESHKVSLGLCCKMHADETASALGIICALLFNFLKAMVEHVLGIFLGVTEPREVDHHVWKYLFCKLAFYNEIPFV